MFRKTWLAVLAGILMTSFCAQAEGELMVLPASTRLFNAHEQMIKVRNVGDAPLYLAVMVEKVMNPGITPEKKVKLRDLTQPGMLATPDKLTLGPNQSRNIRLVSLEEPGQEALYRVYIVPVMAMKVEQAPKDKITAPLSVAIGYGVLVRHMPAPGTHTSGWAHRCENAGITLTNTGNVRVLMTDVKVTPAAPNNSRTIALFPGTPQVIKGHSMTMTVNEQPVTVHCP